MARKKSLSAGGFAVAAKPTPKRVADEVEADFVRAEKIASPSPEKQKRRASKDPSISPSSRGGTMAVPYVRTDGVRTRATTIHLPVKIHEQLRRHCFEQNVSMSQVVSDLISARLPKGDPA